MWGLGVALAAPPPEEHWAVWLQLCTNIIFDSLSRPCLRAVMSLQALEVLHQTYLVLLFDNLKWNQCNVPSLGEVSFTLRLQGSWAKGRMQQTMASW